MNISNIECISDDKTVDKNEEEERNDGREAEIIDEGHTRILSAEKGFQK